MRLSWVVQAAAIASTLFKGGLARPHVHGGKYNNVFDKRGVGRVVTTTITATSYPSPTYGSTIDTSTYLTLESPKKAMPTYSTYETTTDITPFTEWDMTNTMTRYDDEIDGTATVTEFETTTAIPYIKSTPETTPKTYESQTDSTDDGEPESTNYSQPESTYDDQPVPTSDYQSQSTDADQPTTTSGDATVPPYDDQPEPTYGDQPESTYGDQPEPTYGDQPEPTYGDHTGPEESDPEACYDRDGPKCIKKEEEKGSYQIKHACAKPSCDPWPIEDYYDSWVGWKKYGQWCRGRCKGMADPDDYMDRQPIGEDFHIYQMSVAPNQETGIKKWRRAEQTYSTPTEYGTKYIPTVTYPTPTGGDYEPTATLYVNTAYTPTTTPYDEDGDYEPTTTSYEDDDSEPTTAPYEDEDYESTTTPYEDEGYGPTKTSYKGEEDYEPTPNPYEDDDYESTSTAYGDESSEPGPTGHKLNYYKSNVEWHGDYKATEVSYANDYEPAPTGYSTEGYGAPDSSYSDGYKPTTTASGDYETSTPNVYETSTPKTYETSTPDSYQTSTPDSYQTSTPDSYQTSTPDSYESYEPTSTGYHNETYEDSNQTGSYTPSEPYPTEGHNPEPSKSYGSDDGTTINIQNIIDLTFNCFKPILDQYKKVTYNVDYDVARGQQPDLGSYKNNETETTYALVHKVLPPYVVNLFVNGDINYYQAPAHAVCYTKLCASCPITPMFSGPNTYVVPSTCSYGGCNDIVMQAKPVDYTPVYPPTEVPGTCLNVTYDVSHCVSCGQHDYSPPSYNTTTPPDYSPPHDNSTTPPDYNPPTDNSTAPSDYTPPGYHPTVPPNHPWPTVPVCPPTQTAYPTPTPCPPTVNPPHPTYYPTVSIPSPEPPYPTAPPSNSSDHPIYSYPPGTEPHDSVVTLTKSCYECPGGAKTTEISVVNSEPAYTTEAVETPESSPPPSYNEENNGSGDYDDSGDEPAGEENGSYEDNGSESEGTDNNEEPPVEEGAGSYEDHGSNEELPVDEDSDIYEEGDSKDEETIQTPSLSSEAPPCLIANTIAIALAAAVSIFTLL